MHLRFLNLWTKICFKVLKFFRGRKSAFRTHLFKNTQKIRKQKVKHVEFRRYVRSRYGELSWICSSVTLKVQKVKQTCGDYDRKSDLHLVRNFIVQRTGRNRNTDPVAADLCEVTREPGADVQGGAKSQNTSGQLHY